MRQQFVETDSRYKASKECPWANHIAKVCGGFQCFESDSDYNIWKNQK